MSFRQITTPWLSFSKVRICKCILWAGSTFG